MSHCIRLPVALLMLGVSTPAFAQSADDTAACAACGTLAGIGIMLPIIFFVVNIILLVWVARDAKSRGMEGSLLWMVLVMFTSVIGLLIYIFARPKGDLVACGSCGNKRLSASSRCPHCGNA